MTKVGFKEVFDVAVNPNVDQANKATRKGLLSGLAEMTLERFTGYQRLQ